MRYKYVLLVVLINIFSGFLVIFVHSEEQKELKIFYHPFEVETFVALTTENIEKNATCVFEIKLADEDIVLLRELLKNADANSVDYDRVRLKIKFLFENDVFVGEQGHVLRKSGTVTYRLSPTAFEDFKKIIKKHAILAGCELVE